MYKFLCAIMVMATFFGCNGQANKEVPKANEEVLVKRLMSQMVSDPTAQPEKDQNILIDYAIDSLLDVQRSESGLYYMIIEEGEGEHPEITDKVTTHYRGRFLDGKEFDSSYRKGSPMTYPLSGFIKGWQEGIALLKPGGSCVLLVPSHMAYGAQGYPGLIAPNSPLRFDIKLISFQK